MSLVPSPTIAMARGQLDPANMAKAEVDAVANEAKARGTTYGADYDYLRKLEEAKGLLKGSNDPTPYIDAEAAERGISRQQVAQEIIAAADRVIQRRARIEAIRIAAHRAIDAASPDQYATIIQDAIQKIRSIP